MMSLGLGGWAEFNLKLKRRKNFEKAKIWPGIDKLVGSEFLMNHLGRQKTHER